MWALLRITVLSAAVEGSGRVTCFDPGAGGGAAISVLVVPRPGGALNSNPQNPLTFSIGALRVASSNTVGRAGTYP